MTFSVSSDPIFSATMAIVVPPITAIVFSPFGKSKFSVLVKTSQSPKELSFGYHYLLQQRYNVECQSTVSFLFDLVHAKQLIHD